MTTGTRPNRPDPAWLGGFSAAAVLESGPGPADIPSMRLPLWEFTVAVLAILVGLLYLVAGDYYGAAMVFGFTVFLVAVRVRLDDQPETRGGERALRRYRVEMTQVAGLAVLILSTLATMIVAAAQSWQKDTHGSVALFALLGMEVLLLLDAQRRADSALAWLKGGRAETRVATSSTLCASTDGSSSITSPRTEGATSTTSSADRAARTRSRRRVDTSRGGTQVRPRPTLGS